MKQVPVSDATQVRDRRYIREELQKLVGVNSVAVQQHWQKTHFRKFRHLKSTAVKYDNSTGGIQVVFYYRGI